MTLPHPTRLLAALRLLFRRQADEALAALHRGRSEAPDLSHWLKPATELLAPLLAPYYQHGGQEAARRIAAALQAHPELKHRPGWPRRSLRLVRTKSGPGVAFDVHRPEVQAAVQAAALALAQSTLDTSTLGVQQALDATREALAEGLDRGEVLARLTQRVQEVFTSPARAAAVAMTEANRAQHAGGLIAARDSGAVKGLRWLASADACELCAKLDGKEVPLGDAFHVEAKAGPYSRVEHPPLHPHCMCSVTEVLGKPERSAAPAPTAKPNPGANAPAPVAFPQPGTRRPRVLATNPRQQVWRQLTDEELRLPVGPEAVPPEVSRAGAQLAGDITPAEKVAIRRYSDVGYRPLNRLLREHPDQRPSGTAGGIAKGDLGEFFDAISAAIDRAPRFAQPLNLYRGVALAGKEKTAFLAAAQEALRSGLALQLGGFTSASLSPAKDNFGKVRLEIRATHGAYIRELSANPDELEVVLPHNTAFRVVGVKTVTMMTEGGGMKKVQVIQLEQIPDSHKQALPVVRELKASARLVEAPTKAARPQPSGGRFTLATLAGVRLVRPQ